jgi:NADPH-dependent glutamate synthase beta subunit-like oxidoreductase
LTAAQDLAEASHAVHVSEMTDRPGGMMVWGIPAFRLPQGTVEEDMNRMFNHCPGIELHTNCALGRDVSLEELKARHDAVLLTIGAWWGKDMAIPGDNSERIIDGVGFLRKVNDGARPSMPETVLVIGGGDVAMDACRAAKRFPGCKEVKVVYRRGPQEIPARRDELEGALKEDIEFIYNRQPVAAVETEDGGFALRCVETRLGEPEADGRRRPENIPGSESDMPCGLVIMAVGQQAESEELESLGLMNRDRVATKWETMRTGDPKVFAAGDGAFGGSTIVMAMQHGHRAAYYIRCFLEGRDDPVPYRTPFRTRRVPVSQDPKWEVFPRQEQEFHGLGERPVEFPEIESTYDQETAIAEAARCYRCDAETGSADYTVRTREDIFVMARSDATDAHTQKAILEKRLTPRPDPFAEQKAPNLEDLVFLPANLSRLVIDPYRDACNVKTSIAGKLDLGAPFLAMGFDDAPSQVREALAAGLKANDCAYIGAKSLDPDVPWIQILEKGSVADENATGICQDARDGLTNLLQERPNDYQLLGLSVSHDDLARAIPAALDLGYDFLLLRASDEPGLTWAELPGSPELAILRDAIAILRKMNREEDIELLFFGGVRSGTDAAKLLGLGAKACVLGVSLALAMGGEIQGRDIAFTSEPGDEERKELAALFIQSLTGETSIMARCTGKTDIHNLEPEDLRSITMVTARAAGVPLAGTHHILSPR